MDKHSRLIYTWIIRQYIRWTIRWTIRFTTMGGWWRKLKSNPIFNSVVVEVEVWVELGINNGVTRNPYLSFTLRFHSWMQNLSLSQLALKLVQLNPVYMRVTSCFFCHFCFIWNFTCLQFFHLLGHFACFYNYSMWWVDNTITHSLSHSLT